jgi:hypothetical protein
LQPPNDYNQGYSAGWDAAKRHEQEPVAWVSPLRYGSQVTFAKPVKPEGWDDEDGEWYCRPLYNRAERAAALSTEEVEWLEYAVAHMLDDSEPEDQACAAVLRELIDRRAERWGVPDGLVLVPREPTPEMLKAGFLSGSNGFDVDQPADAPGLVYRAMLDAAPNKDAQA